MHETNHGVATCYVLYRKYINTAVIVQYYYWPTWQNNIISDEWPAATLTEFHVLTIVIIILLRRCYVLHSKSIRIVFQKFTFCFCCMNCMNKTCIIICITIVILSDHYSSKLFSCFHRLLRWPVLSSELSPVFRDLQHYVYYIICMEIPPFIL